MSEERRKKTWADYGMMAGMLACTLGVMAAILGVVILLLGGGKSWLIVGLIGVVAGFLGFIGFAFFLPPLTSEERERILEKMRRRRVARQRLRASRQ